MRKTKFKLNDKVIAHVGRPEQSFYKGGKEENTYAPCHTQDCTNSEWGWVSCIPTQCYGWCYGDGGQITEVIFTCESFWDDCDIPCVE